MLRIVFFIGILGLFSLGMGPLTAQAEDSAYFVKDVQVDVLDASAVKARNKAFVEAQKKAFLMLAARFETPEAMANLAPPEDRVLSGLIQDFEISSEQLSTKRYRGQFDFRFKAAAVNRYFGHGPVVASAPVQSSEPLKTLILPFYQGADGPIVFDKAKNPFWVSLAQGLTGDLKESEIVILPEGSISDITDIGSSTPNNLSAGTIRRLLARYEVDDVVAVLAHVDLKTPQVVKIDMYNTKNGQIGLTTSLNIAPDLVASETFKAVKGEPVTSVLETEVATPIPAPIAEPEKPVEKLNPSPSVPPSTMPGVKLAKVFFLNMSEWIAMQKTLAHAPGVSRIRMTSLKSNQVDIVIEYKDWAQVSTALPSLGLNLMAQPDGTYIIKR